MHGQEVAGAPPPGKDDCPRPIFDWEEGDDDCQHTIGEAGDDI